MEVTIPLATREEALALFGLRDRNLKYIRDALGLRIAARENLIRLQGEKLRLEVAADILNEFLRQLRDGTTPDDDWLETQVEREVLRRGAFASPNGDPTAFAGDAWTTGEAPQGTFEGVPETDRPAQDTALTSDELTSEAAASEQGAESGPGSATNIDESIGGGLPPPRAAALERRPHAALDSVDPASSAATLGDSERSLVASLARTPGQGRYVTAMLRNELVFCIGPAGTGKTFLSVHMAVHYLRKGDVRRLILCRPAVEAGEKLGFLPGDLQAKINPYLRPLYDALNDALGFEQVKRYMEREIIEVVPLAYMRGRTLNHAFIILDEGQNTTISQMKMFLTRMGTHSRIVVNGDITQVDLPSGQPSGLVHAQRIIRNIRGVSWSRLDRPDIVRHRLVQRIVEAYESEEGGRQRKDHGRSVPASEDGPGD
jgi:phosphate starvation-inducible protein PhoH